MKKPSYRSYKKKVKKEKHIEIPEKIDTREAEQLVEDIYRLGEFLKRHQSKFIAAVVALILAVGAYVGYNYYIETKELQAASIVDKGLFSLENNDLDSAIKAFKEAQENYFSTPSGKIAAFLFGKFSNSTESLKKVSNTGSFTLSPAAKVVLAVNLLKKGDLDKAELILSSIERSKDWTYPEALYYLIILNLKKGNVEKAEEIRNILAADYGNSIYSQLAQELLR